MTTADKIAALPLPPMTTGEALHFEHPPCFRCGYNGHGYYQTADHRCAQAYHAFKNADDGWLYARLSLALEVLKNCVGEDAMAPCRLDHHGNCQEHYVEQPCRIADARLVLEAMKE